LIETARELENGRDLAGKELKGSPHFFIGAVVTPEADVLEPQILKMERKVEAGRNSFRLRQSMMPGSSLTSVGWCGISKCLCWRAS